MKPEQDANTNNSYTRELVVYRNEWNQTYRHILILNHPSNIQMHTGKSYIWKITLLVHPVQWYWWC